MSKGKSGVSRGLLRQDGFIFKHQTKLFDDGDLSELLEDAIEQTEYEIREEIRSGSDAPEVKDWVRRIEARFKVLALEELDYEGREGVRSHKRFVIFARDGFRCFYCGRRSFESDVQLTVDHVVPSAKGGSSTAGNLVTCCRECNSQKSASRLANEDGVLEVVSGRNDKHGIGQNIKIRH